MTIHKYDVIADFIHPHKDCCGEGESNLEYDEAMKLVKEWTHDKVHKNVRMIRDDEW